MESGTGARKKGQPRATPGRAITQRQYTIVPLQYKALTYTLYGLC